jgi:hypothetical protein
MIPVKLIVLAAAAFFSFGCDDGDRSIQISEGQSDQDAAQNDLRDAGKDVAISDGTASDIRPNPDSGQVGAEYPPILVTVNAHGHNYGFPRQALQTGNFANMKATRYQKHRGEVMWLDEQARRVGAKMSYQLNGEYARDARLAEDDQHIRDLEAAGHSIGTHFHRFYLTEDDEFWQEFSAGQATFETVQRTWTDHIREVEAALGHPLLRCDPAAGSHDENDLLYPEFNIQIEPGGEVFSYTDWNIKPWNPYRRKVGTYCTEDSEGPRVAVASLGQVGSPEPQGLHSVHTTTSQLKRHFLMLLAEWREHERRGDPPKVWAWGIMTHPSSNHLYRDEMLDMFNFLAAFTDAETPRGTPIARFATDEEVAETFRTWEVENPGASSFDFDWESHLAWITQGTGSPQPYPYLLEGVTLGLRDCDYVGELESWDQHAVRVHQFTNVDIMRGLANESGQRSMTLGSNRLPVYLLWSDSGQGETIDFSSEKSGTLYVKDGISGAVTTADATRLTVTETPIVVSETNDYF